MFTRIESVMRYFSPSKIIPFKYCKENNIFRIEKPLNQKFVRTIKTGNYG